MLIKKKMSMKESLSDSDSYLVDKNQETRYHNCEESSVMGFFNSMETHGKGYTAEYYEKDIESISHQK